MPGLVSIHGRRLMLGAQSDPRLFVDGVPLGIGSVPTRGSYYFVDPANGDDDRDGLSPETALDTLSAALDLCTAGKNDTVVLIGDGGTTGTARESATLTWSKNATHLIAITAPTMISQRARISHPTAATTNINPLMTVSASGCVFANFSLFQGVGQASTDEQLFTVTGDRNYFYNVHFGGMGHANGAARAGSYTLYVNGGDENTFEGCTIGLDTVTRSAANASVKFGGAATRNIFKGCVFPLMTSAATPLFIDANSSGSIDRFNWFKDCMFHNAVNSTSTAVTAVVSFHASQGGTIFLDNCSAVGANDWTATDTATVKVTGPVPNGDTSGMAASADAT